MDDFDVRAKTWDDDPKKNERARIAAETIAREVPLSKNMRSLEYGCGTGLLSFALHTHLGPITMADSSTGMLQVLREKIAANPDLQMTPLLLDLGVDPLPGQKFDFIYTLMTMHHVADVKRLLGNFHELCDDLGYLCIIDLDAEDGSFHGKDFSGHRGFDRTDLASMAEEAGWRQVHFKTVYRIVREGKEFSIFLMSAKRSADLVG